MIAAVAPVVLDELRAPPDARGSTNTAVVAVQTTRGLECAVLPRPGSVPRARPESPFPLYSITKTFLAATALRLVHRRVLLLDDHISRWLPSAPHASRITVRHLLQHTSGLPDYGPLPAYHAAVREGGTPWSDEEFMARTCATTLLFEPGSGWAYSNIGYMLVRRLIETVFGGPLAQALAAELFNPLALHDTFVPTNADLGRLVVGESAYLGAGNPVQVTGHYPIGWVAHGLIASSASDVARFLSALLDGCVLPQPLVSEMCSPRDVGTVPTHVFRRPGYGLGLMVDSGADRGPILGHAGEGPGASTAVYQQRLGGAPLTVAVLTDGEDGHAERIALRVLSAPELG